MKWIDLVVEICKFELRRDFRLKEVFSIKTSSEGNLFCASYLTQYHQS